MPSVTKKLDKTLNNLTAQVDELYTIKMQVVFDAQAPRSWKQWRVKNLPWVLGILIDEGVKLEREDSSERKRFNSFGLYTTQTIVEKISAFFYLPHFHSVAPPPQNILRQIKYFWGICSPYTPPPPQVTPWFDGFNSWFLQNPFICRPAFTSSRRCHCCIALAPRHLWFLIRS
jgi:hypothetical protein